MTVDMETRTDQPTALRHILSISSFLRSVVSWALEFHAQPLMPNDRTQPHGLYRRSWRFQKQASPQVSQKEKCDPDQRPGAYATDKAPPKVEISARVSITGFKWRSGLASDLQSTHFSASPSLGGYHRSARTWTAERRPQAPKSPEKACN